MIDQIESTRLRCATARQAPETLSEARADVMSGTSRPGLLPTPRASDILSAGDKVFPLLPSAGARLNPETSAPAQSVAAVCDSRASEMAALTETPLQLLEGSIGRPPDDWRIQEANRRQEILQTYAQLLAQGKTKAEAVKAVGVGYATIWRWEKKFKAHGYNGLLPETENCGRKNTFEKLGFTPEQVEQIRNEVQGLNLDLKSVTSSLRVFANSDRCPEALANVILDPNRCSKHALPPSLREAAKVNKTQRKAHEGPRSLSLGGIWIPRRMDILPGDIFTADDTTPIWAWWVPWVQNEDYPFGVKLLQGQFIPVLDVASQCVVTYVLIAREKSSYRASDIWHLFGHTFDQVGLPRLGFQLERGSWEANIIRGQEVEYQENEITYSRRVGGLRQLPTNVTAWHQEKFGADFQFPKTLQTWTSFLPKTKSIEAWFNRDQNLESTLWGALGRDQMRKPYEKAKKRFQECSRPRAKVDPREHFLSHLEIAARINQIVGYLNSEPMEGEVFKGVPKINFDSAISEHPLFQLPDETRWLYRRDWATGPKDNPLRITNGWARVRLTDPLSGERYSLFYTNPEVFPKYEGEQIVVYYDRENFQQPAQIILAKTGEYLCEAQYEDRRGSFLGGDQSGYDIQKRWKNAVMSTYGTLVKHAPSRQLPPEIAARRAASREAAKQRDGETGTATTGTTTVDQRPSAAVLPSKRSILTPPTSEEFARKKERLAAQAAAARNLRALAGEE